jgi:hypothetical protein
MRDYVTTALEVAGMMLLAAGAGMAWLPAGLMVAGLCMVAVGAFGART